MAYYASFDSIHSATNPNGNNFLVGSAVAASSIRLYPVDPTVNPTNTGSFVSTGSAQSVWLEYVDGNSAAQLVECTLTNGSEQINGGSEDAWVFRVNATGQLFVLTSGGYTVSTGSSVQINSSIALSDLDQLVAEQAPPVTTALSALDISTDSGTDGDFVTNTAGQTVVATLSAALAGGEKLYGSVDGGATWADVTGSVSGTALTWTGVTLGAGASSIQLKVANAINSGPVATRAYVLDTTAPTTTPSSIDITADSGVDGDFVTNTAGQAVTAALSAALAGGERLLGSVDGGATWADVSGSVAGTALTWTGVTLSGSSSIRLKVVDAADNSGPVAAQAYVLDTTAPTTALSAIDISTDSGADGDFVTDTAGQAVTATLSVGLANGETLLGSSDGGATWTDVSGFVSGTALTWTGVTLAGSGSIRLKVADLAGNDGPVAAQAYIVDAAAPTTGVSGLDISADSGADGDFVTNVAAQTITGTLSAPLAAGERLLGSVDGGATWADVTGSVSGTAVSWTGAALSGASSIQMKVTDPAGNGGPAASQAYTLDAAAPTTTLSAIDISDDSGTDGDFVTNAAAQTVTAALSAALAGGETLLGSADGGATWADVSGSVSGTALTWAGVTLSGASSLELKVVDPAGNIGSVAVQAYALDTQAPAVTAALSSDDGVSATDGVTSDAGLSGTGDPGATVAIRDGTTVLATAVADGQGKWSVPGSALGLADGTYALTVSATDAAGNTGAANAAFTLDTVPAAPSVSALVTNDATPAVSGGWGGYNGGTDALSVTVNGVTYTAGASSALQVNGTAWVLRLPGPLADGAYDVTATAARAGGGSAQATANDALTVDTVAPAVAFGLTRDSNAFDTVGIVRTEALTGTGSPGATLDFFEGTVAIGTAVAGADGEWTFLPPDLGDGARTIVVRETDAAGNAGTASLEFRPVASPAPVGGDSVADWRSMDLAELLNAGGKLQLPAGTERAVLADGTLTVGSGTNEAFLTRLYFGVLGRAPEAEGISGWQHAHDHGLGRAALADDFLRQAESVASLGGGQTGAQFVQELYEGVLGRQGEAWEVSLWTARLDAGDTRGAVLAGIADSPEAKGQWAGVVAEGVWVRDADAALVRAAYLGGLGREAEADGLRFWSGALKGGATPDQVGAWIGSTAEFQSRHGQQDDAAFVRSLYADGLGRQGEAEGVAHWADALGAGAVTRGDVLMAFAQSEEGQHHLYWAL